MEALEDTVVDTGTSMYQTNVEWYCYENTMTGFILLDASLKESSPSYSLARREECEHW